MKNNIDSLIDKVIEGVDPITLLNEDKETNEFITESFLLSKQDKLVIDSFVDKTAKEGKLLSTDGKRLDVGSGSLGLARWQGEGIKARIKIRSDVPSVKHEKVIVRYLKKKAPGKWFLEK